MKGILLAIYKDIKNELDKTEAKAKELTAELQKKCPHNHIFMNSYINDDWAQHKTYTVAFKCDFCGLYSSYDEYSRIDPSETFYKMIKMYNKQCLKERNKK